jgi:EF hand domain-containing protein
MNCRVLLALMFTVGALDMVSADDKPGPPVDPQAKAFADWQQQMVKMFDADNDGKLSDQEKLIAQEAMRRQGVNVGMAPGGFPGSDQFAKQFDRNGDGKLDQMESMAAQAMFQRMRNSGHGGMQGGVRSGGGGGSLPQPAMPVAPAGNAKPAKVNPLVKRFDKDGDGKLNAEEKAAAQAELKNKDAKDAKKEKPKK